MTKMSLGNPQLGVADPAKPQPPLTVMDIEGNEVGWLSICPDCGGYYMAQCPCWFRKGGRNYPLAIYSQKKWWQFWIKGGKP